MEKQKAVFINTVECTKHDKLLEITKELLKDTPILRDQSEHCDSYSWDVDTKYYNADIDISFIKKKSIVSETFSNSVQAVLLYFDSDKNSQGLQEIKSWMPFVEAWEPEIKLAVCERCDREGRESLSRVAVQEWCLDHEFELVELDPDMEDYDEYEEVGVKRIRSALCAHMWPAMTMKNPQNAVKKMQPTSCGVDLLKRSVAPPPETAESRINGLLGMTESDGILGDGDDDNFEKLFSKMSVMKEKAEALPDAERKKYAENVVKAFWSALGGDEEELEGLSSEDENDAKTVENKDKR